MKRNGVQVIDRCAKCLYPFKFGDIQVKGMHKDCYSTYKLERDMMWICIGVLVGLVALGIVGFLNKH